jgi:hypothetical protein
VSHSLALSRSSIECLIYSLICTQPHDHRRKPTVDLVDGPSRLTIMNAIVRLYSFAFQVNLITTHTISSVWLPGKSETISQLNKGSLLGYTILNQPIMINQPIMQLQWKTMAMPCYRRCIAPAVCILPTPRLVSARMIWYFFLGILELQLAAVNASMIAAISAPVVPPHGTASIRLSAPW